MGIRKWTDLTPSEKMQWFDNSIRIHEDLPIQKKRKIWARIEKERKKAEQRAKRRKPKWWQRKK
ncbi:hypothetical protein SEA_MEGANTHEEKILLA_247 [Streptomyces phage MeganTheeKilla]|uniref:Uncharacterized protein n=1 Tax=Streptomyces phage MeganTheeKilla TaxID=2801897 RepID=A0A7U0GCA3_9CAUD|nr:hypothetical protein SEA_MEGANTHEEKILLA_247 [Streptomyces phage MeganTheeKilla]